MQKSYNNNFMFSVVLEVLKGDLTIAEIISKYKISKSVIHKWKKQFLSNVDNVYK